MQVYAVLLPFLSCDLLDVADARGRPGPANLQPHYDAYHGQGFAQVCPREPSSRAGFYYHVQPADIVNLVMTDDEKSPQIPDSILPALEEIAATDDVSKRSALIADLRARHPEQASAIRDWLYFYSVDISDADESDRITFGPYTQAKLIGEGGFGEVYVALQSEPSRKVAIKLIKIGKDASDVAQRFLQEREILASLDHPAIAKVYDGGTTNDERPYLVMEYVKDGAPITSYCDANVLSIRERVILLEKVCRGVQHSHQRGIWHRDLKPANILASRVEGEHVPKVIDFGIAKYVGHHIGAGQMVHTVRGDILGTYDYMPPEQAGGNTLLTSAIDVYALGVILYELLAGHRPFDFTTPYSQQPKLKVLETLEAGVDEAPSVKVKRMAVGRASDLAARRNRRSPAEWAREISGDLDQITMKAMRPGSIDRYQSPGELADELQRYLHHEPVEARKGNASYRLRKFTRKYRVQVVAAAILLTALLVGTGGIYWMHLRAQHALASFDQLSGIVRLEDALAEADLLWPAWPDKATINALEEWLDCSEELLALQPQLELTISELRKRAVERSPDQLLADQSESIFWPDYENQMALVKSLRRAHAISIGLRRLELPDFEEGRLLPQMIESIRKCVDPDRECFGQEAKAYRDMIWVMRNMLRPEAPNKVIVFRLLAWAEFANGLYKAAEKSARLATNHAKPGLARRECKLYERDLKTMIAKAPARLAAEESKLAALKTKVMETRKRSFGSDAKSQSAQFLHDSLVQLQTRLQSMAAKQKLDIEQRLAWAKMVPIENSGHPNTPTTWADARAAIAKADGKVASILYKNKSIHLHPKDVIGLVPIGMNPVTKLWEFYDLRSAWDGKLPWSQIPIPKHETDGSIEVKDDTGIVFVLLPGGTVTLGCQSDDKTKPFYDPQCRPHETLHEVTLSPFLLARHELTRGQWRRLAGEQQMGWKAGRCYDGDWVRIGPTHPADSMNWDTARLWMTRHGMTLPTEAQWEYGARGGTDTVFWSGQKDTSLQDCANVLDYPNSKWGEPVSITDKYRSLAPVGSFRANAFGLYDVHGNVAEWCLEDFSRYGNEQEGDGRRPDSGHPLRSLRGGACNSQSADARSANREFNAPSLLGGVIGLRPARLITE